MQTYSTVSTEVEGLDDWANPPVLGLNTLKMEIKKADDVIHKHMEKINHASKPSRVGLMYSKFNLGVLLECQKFLGRMETEIDLIEEKAGWQNEAAFVGRIQYCILETQSVQETVKVMEESSKEFDKVWEGWEKAVEEFEKALDDCKKVWERWNKGWVNGEEWDGDLKLKKAKEEYVKASEAMDKATEEWFKAEEELRLKKSVVDGVRLTLIEQCGRMKGPGKKR